MKASEFVDVVEKIVRDASVADVISITKNPPGRQPDKELVEVSKWYNSLEANDQAMIVRMLEMVAHDSVVGFLCVLDGVRAVEKAGVRKGYFELRYITGEKIDVLSGPAGEILHELAE